MVMAKVKMLEFLLSPCRAPDHVYVVTPWQAYGGNNVSLWNLTPLLCKAHPSPIKASLIPLVKKKAKIRCYLQVRINLLDAFLLLEVFIFSKLSRLWTVRNLDVDCWWTYSYSRTCEEKQLSFLGGLLSFSCMSGVSIN